MASPHTQPNHLASLLQGLSAGTPSPAPPSPAPSSAGQADVNTLLRMLSGGGAPAVAAAAPPAARSPPPPASPPANGASSLSLLDLLNQRPSGPPAAPSPTHSYGSGSRYEASPSQAARSDVSQAGSPGGRLGGTSLMEMLMQGLPPTSPSNGFPPPPPQQQQQQQLDHLRGSLSPPPSTSMNPLLAQQQQQQQQRSSGTVTPGQTSTGFTSPSPPPSESMALRIEPQSPPAPPVDPAPQPSTANAASTPAPAQPEPPSQPKPSPSPFSFKSPFDAFGPMAGKRSKSVSATATAGTTSPSSAAVPAVPRSTSFHVVPPPALAPSTASVVEPAPSTPTSASSTARAPSPLAPASPAKSRTPNVSAPPGVGSPLGHTRTGSGSLRFKKGDVFPSGKWRAKGLKEGNFSAASVPDRERFASVDVSKPNLDTLVANKAAMSKRPISIIRSDLVFAPGRTVEGTTFIAYAMNKGRVRLIDEASGARALLKLPSEWYHRDSQVIDLAANGSLVAAITTDGGLVIWRVPTSWAEDDPDCELCYATGPSDDESVRLALVRWVSPSRLAVSSASAVWLLDIEHLSKGWARAHPGNLDGIQRESFACRIAGSSIVDFAVHPAPSANGGTQVAIVSADGALGMHVVDANLAVDDFWRGRVSDGTPSSVLLLDSDLLLVGANKGTTLRLFSLSADASGGPDFSKPLDEVRFQVPDGTPTFGKVEYDRRRELVWVSNTARCSLYALRLDRGTRAASPAAFTKLVEFPLDDPVTSFVVKATEFDAFTVSPNGVDMLSFAADVVEELLQPAVAAPVAANGSHPVKQAPRAVVDEPSAASQPPAPVPQVATQPDLTPKSTPVVTQAAAAPSPPTPSAAAAATDSELSRAVLAELAKAEENILYHVTASLKLQSAKLEAADVRRQEKVFAVLSQELGANHSSLVVDAIRAELQASVLPALTAVITAEVRSVIQQQIAQGVAEAINTRTVFHSVDAAVKDLVKKTLIPSFNFATADMGAALTREVRQDMVSIRKEVVREQSGALVETNDLLAEMATHIQALGRQVAELQSTVVGLEKQVVAIPQHPRQTSPAPSPAANDHRHHHHHRQQQPQPQQQQQAFVGGSQPHQHQQHAHAHQGHAPFSSAPFGNPPMRSPLIQAMPIHPASLAYPAPIGPGPSSTTPFAVDSPLQHAHQPPPPPSQQQQQQGSPDWGDVFTEAFLSPDPAALATLTRRIGPSLDSVLPDVPLLGGARALGPDQRGPLSQAVLLTTVHKFTESLPRAFANTADFASAIVVIARASRLLDTTDPTIVPYAHRVIAQVLPALQRTEEALVAGAGAAAGAGGGGGMAERTRTFFVESLRAVRADLAGKAAAVAAAAAANGR